MATLDFKNGIFYFYVTERDSLKIALDAGFKKTADSFQLESRSPHKAAKLRRFATKTAEEKLRKTFITEFESPEQIVYPDHLLPKVFQIESAWHGVTRSPAYIADEAGLGKTITAILCMNTIKGKSLIICPPFLKYNWAKEFEKWSAKDRSHLVVESGWEKEVSFQADIIILPDSLISNQRIRDVLTRYRFEWLIVDEAHRFKETNAKRTEALFGSKSKDGIFELSHRKILLSGTPIPNGRPIEIYGPMSAICSEAIGFRDRLSFGRLFCGAKQLTRHTGRSQTQTNWDFSGATNLKQLRHELHAKLMIRHLKRDVMKELGPKTRKIVFLDAPKSLEPLEKRLLKKYTMEELGRGAVLGDLATYRREVGEAKILDSFSYINQLLEDNKEKLVVFAHHIDVVETLNRMLSHHGSLTIRGGMTALQKQEIADQFQNDDKCRVVVGNMESMGLGLTLTKAPGAVIVEPSWTPGVNQQAEDRIHRITQNQNVYIRYLVLRGTLDERMLHQILSKDENIEAVLG